MNLSAGHTCFVAVPFLLRRAPGAPLAAACLALWGCSSAEDAQTVPTVRAASVEATAAGADDVLTGVVRARHETALGFRVGGKVTARLVDAGQQVRRGQVLAILDSNDLDLVRAAAAEQVRAAEANAMRSAADEERMRGLVATGSVSASAYDGARAARDAAAASLTAARASAANAANAASYAVLRADAAGMVMETLAEPGQVVAAGAPVLRVALAGQREALITVPETRIAGLPATASAQLYGSTRRVRARLREVAGTADPVTRSFAVRYRLDGPELPLGATISLNLVDAGRSALSVPLSALVDLGHGQGLWLLDRSNKVHFRMVKPLRLEDERAVLPAGSLPVGSRVVALGGHLLREGLAVRLEPAVEMP